MGKALPTAIRHTELTESSLRPKKKKAKYMLNRVSIFLYLHLKTTVEGTANQNTAWERKGKIDQLVMSVMS